MNKRLKGLRFLLTAAVVAAVLASTAGYLGSHDIAVLTPSGTVASEQRELIIKVVLLMLIVVIPVYFMTFFFAFRYREGKKSKYSPDWSGNRAMEITWWAIPAAIILVISVMIWTTSHSLDPFRPISGRNRPLTVQVVALQWKWLFIYPEQKMATVNYLEIPVDTPVNFVITADAPMNSFWIPKLGSQIYAMPGMSTQLHLKADQTGEYIGSSANISGEGFAGMHFKVKAVSSGSFKAWITSVKNGGGRLDGKEYALLAEPTKNEPATYYASTEDGLYDKVINKYMHPVDEHGGNDLNTAPAHREGHSY